LNRYGISTEYSGKVVVNMNIAIQSKQVLEKERNKMKDKQGREAYNLMSNIQSQMDSEVNYGTSEVDEGTSMMKTKSHGLINRFSNNS
jgi:hypothetical protein